MHPLWSWEQLGQMRAYLQSDCGECGWRMSGPKHRYLYLVTESCQTNCLIANLSHPLFCMSPDSIIQACFLHIKFCSHFSLFFLTLPGRFEPKLVCWRPILYTCTESVQDLQTLCLSSVTCQLINAKIHTMKMMLYFCHFHNLMVWEYVMVWHLSYNIDNMRG